MDLKGKQIGVVLTGSHCTINQVLQQIKNIKEQGANVIPILSETVINTDTRFGSSQEWLQQVIEITGNEPIKSITEAEPIGPKELFDVIVVAPCTGNTLAKLANGITDTAALMAIKAQLRNLRPVVLAISTNDGLGINAKNIGLLINMKRIYMVPFGQDNCKTKENSLVANVDLIIPTIISALKGVQHQPVLIQYSN
ncbi:dipicolinate synthase subunit B [Desulfitispora alkaliphila]|uniref:dipicolinate synthase subunit B n=1 Tax=Desulfitispora alkaliphila TaxID=622674 RepID=UPI003D1A9FCB